MYVRLGFAVAVEVDPDILLVDEVLAVGDASFQRKCLRRMAEFREQNKTMLIISHDLGTIQSVSDQILFLDHGRVLGHGDPGKVVGQYETFWRNQASAERSREWGTREVVLTGAEFSDESGDATTKFKWDHTLKVKLGYEVKTPVGASIFGFGISDEAGRLVHGSNTEIAAMSIPGLSGSGFVELEIPHLNLARGTYFFSFSVHSADHKVNYHRMDNAFAIGVESDMNFEGICNMPSKWRIG